MLVLSQFGMCHPDPLPPSVVSRSHRYLLRPAIFTDLNVGNAVPAVETGWEGKSLLASPSLLRVQRLKRPSTTKYFKDFHGAGQLESRTHLGTSQLQFLSEPRSQFLPDWR